MKELRIIIAGGRDFHDYMKMKISVNKILVDLVARRQSIGIGNEEGVSRENIKFISGNARGADITGERFAEEYGFTIKKFIPDWDGFGKRAGYVRNAEMAKFAVEDDNCGVLIAFWDGKSRGTKYMIDLANKYGLEVHVVNYKETSK